MDFPITDLLDDQQSQRWLEAYFHPDGLHCPDCGASPAAAYRFRRTQCSRLQVYRCRHCGKTYNLYIGTVFAHRQLSAPQVVMLLRGIFQGESSAQLSRELALSRTTVLKIRRAIQDQAAAGQIISPLADEQSETDEMFQNAGKKASRIATRKTHPVDEPTNGAGTALTSMIALPSWAPSGALLVKCGCRWFSGPIAIP